MKNLLARVSVRRTSQFSLFKWKGYILPLAFILIIYCPVISYLKTVPENNTHMYYLATLMSLESEHWCLTGSTECWD